jgi:hypothetical protein
MLKSKRILLARGNSYLENAVSGIIVDSLFRRGYSVTVLDVKSLVNEDPNVYRASIIFNGVISSRLFEPVAGYTSNFKDRESNILICTAYGERWDGKKVEPDAVTAATKSLDPAEVTAKVLKNIYDILGKGPSPGSVR